MPTPLAARTLDRLIDLALARGVKGLKEELVRLENLDPKEPNFRAKMEYRLKIMRLLSEMKGDLSGPGKGKPKKSHETPDSREPENEVPEDDIETRQQRIQEGRKKLDKTGAK